jgi:Holliday junction resolvasome RuvABC DNA-binding subunit
MSDVNDALRRLKQLEELERTAQRDMDRAQGELDAGMKTLEELGFKTITAANKELDKLETRQHTLEEELINEVEQLEAACQSNA